MDEWGSADRKWKSMKMPEWAQLQMEEIDFQDLFCLWVAVPRMLHPHGPGRAQPRKICRETQHGHAFVSMLSPLAPLVCVCVCAHAELPLGGHSVLLQAQNEEEEEAEPR